MFFLPGFNSSESENGLISSVLSSFLFNLSYSNTGWMMNSGNYKLNINSNLDFVNTIKELTISKFICFS